MKNFIVLVGLAGIAAFAGACGSSGNSTGAAGQAPGGTPVGSPQGTGAPNVPGTPVSPGMPVQPSDCATAWTAYINANPAGRVLTYSISTHTTVSGHDMVTGSDTETDSIVESSDDHVTTTIAARHGNHSVTIAKSQFMQMCGNTGSFHPPVSGTIIEQDQQAIDVAAGHFDCHHFKYQASGATSTSETWTDLHGEFLVKSVVIVNASAAAVMTTFKELTQVH